MRRRSDDVSVADLEVLRRSWPALVWVEARVGVGTRSDRYQVLVGLRPSGEPAPFLQGHADLTLGELDTDTGPAYGYDALVDPDLAVEIVHLMAPDEDVSRARLVPGEQSNTSVVVDERLFLKVFRRLHAGPNPEVEVTRELFERAFLHVVEPVAEWRRDDTDLAVLQGYLGGGVDGWAMALTSLRDLFAVQETQPIPIISDTDPAPEPVDPSAAGGDFSGEAERLGDMTAELHVALVDAFGARPVTRACGPAPSTTASHARSTAISTATACGRGSRPCVASTIPVRPSACTATITSVRSCAPTRVGTCSTSKASRRSRSRSGDGPRRPLKDVAGMLRSLHYASMVAMFERDEEHTDEAAAWEQRNREAFLTGYLPKARAAGVVPDDETSTAVLLAAFETEKALYELGYEQAHRPEWARIPLAALRRLSVE